jgi:acetylornithine deacetylase/succinyl-diaminopimelate desuccinylase-like protein
MISEQIKVKVKDSVDRNELAEMMTEMVNIPSPSGSEAEMTRYLAQRFGSLGMSVEFQEVESGRSNLICRSSDRGVPKVMFNGHMDTSRGGGAAQARREGDWIFGPGASNMKPAFAAYYMAIKMIQKAAIRLGGGVAVTAVVGEIEGAPVDGYQGPGFRAGGIGSMLLAHRGVAADYCIIGEPTGLRVQIGTLGYALVRFGTKGKRAHLREKHLGVSAIDKAIKIKEAIERWEENYQEMHPHPFMKPRLNVGAIAGGNPHNPGSVPTACSLYMSIGIMPGQGVPDLLKELTQATDHLRDSDGERSATVDLFWFRRGFELAKDHELVRTMEKAHLEVLGAPSVFPDPYRFCVSSDCGYFCENGIPSLTYGPGGINRSAQFTNYDEAAGTEPLSLANLEACSKVYALALLDLCGVA